MPARASAAFSSDAHEAHAFQQRVVLGRRLERAVEVVERRQQLLGQAATPRSCAAAAASRATRLR